MMDSHATHPYDYCQQLGRESDNALFHFSPITKLYPTTMMSLTCQQCFWKAPGEADTPEASSLDLKVCGLCYMLFHLLQ